MGRYLGGGIFVQIYAPFRECPVLLNPSGWQGKAKSTTAEPEHILRHSKIQEAAGTVKSGGVGREQSRVETIFYFCFFTYF